MQDEVVLYCQLLDKYLYRKDFSKFHLANLLGVDDGSFRRNFSIYPQKVYEMKDEIEKILGPDFLSWQAKERQKLRAKQRKKQRFKPKLSKTKRSHQEEAEENAYRCLLTAARRQG